MTTEMLNRSGQQAGRVDRTGVEGAFGSQSAANKQALQRVSLGVLGRISRSHET